MRIICAPVVFEALPILMFCAAVDCPKVMSPVPLEVPIVYVAAAAPWRVIAVVLLVLPITTEVALVLPIFTAAAPPVSKDSALAPLLLTVRAPEPVMLATLLKAPELMTIPLMVLVAVAAVIAPEAVIEAKVLLLLSLSCSRSALCDADPLRINALLDDELVVTVCPVVNELSWFLYATLVSVPAVLILVPLSWMAEVALRVAPVIVVAAARLPVKLAVEDIVWPFIRPLVMVPMFTRFPEASIL
jgi:hypothetical protein